MTRLATVLVLATAAACSPAPPSPPADQWPAVAVCGAPDPQRPRPRTAPPARTHAPLLRAPKLTYQENR